MAERRVIDMRTGRALQVIEQWPDESREPATLVIDGYGEPDEMSPSMLIWHDRVPWKRIVATRQFYEHNFPAPHVDAVESFIDYHVPTEMFTPLAEFDGSVVVERTAGEVSARCHDIEANYLALNLMHDIVTGTRTVEDARKYYADEFLAARRTDPTPYMEGLRFRPAGDTVDRDQRLLSDEQLNKAATHGGQKG